MFIYDEDLVDVSVYYKKIGKVYQAYTELAFKEDVSDEKDKLKFKKLVVSMKCMTWGLYNELQEIGTYYDENIGKNMFNFKKYKEEKLKKLIVKWDATIIKDGVETPVPVTEKNIMSLAPSIAESLISSYDELSVLDEDDEKN